VRSLKFCTDAFDWKLFVFTDIVHSALEGVYLDVIGKSLEYPLWNEQELGALFDQASQAEDVKGAWKSVMAGERYTFLRNSNSGQLSPGTPKVPLHIMRLPQSQLRILEVVRQMQELEGSDLRDFLARLNQFDKEIGSQIQRMQIHPGNIVLSIFMPACGAYASVKERMEDRRRLIRTGVKIKLFRLQNGRWPNELKELQSIGASADDWSTLNLGEFGYSVEGEQAWLWTYDLRSPPLQIPITRPALDAENSSVLQVLLLR